MISNLYGFSLLYFQFQVSVVCIPKFEMHAYFYGQDQEKQNLNVFIKKKFQGLDLILQMLIFYQF